MANTVIIGMQWGDEGKGKIVDLLCPAFDAVARYQGGNNAGHTVRFGDSHFALHFIPSGVLHPQMRCVLGNGMVFNPDAFFEELEGLAGHGIDWTGRLFVSDRAHLLLPAHIELDGARERARGADRIGTTARGIGPAYETKISRFGVRVGEIIGGSGDSRLDALVRRLGDELAQLDASRPDADALTALCRGWGARLEPMVRDTAQLLNGWIDDGLAVLFEGAQGTLLDVDHGTYPYVTSSNSTAGGVCTGTGVPPKRLSGVLGILKAYTTRVGRGPFPAELTDERGDFLRERGNEFGTTTGRPRRCGWLDTVVARYSQMINGVDSIALTKLDVLDTFEEIKICTAYRIGDRETTEFPSTLEEIAAAEPQYETVPGWKAPTDGILEFDDLPAEARDYVRLAEELVGAPIGLVSTSPRREETIVRTGAGLEPLTSDRLDRVIARRDGE
ncbi:MAG: adenylosuccinate synthase [Acidobacteriota bacterium]|nr:adenylosuccinate synthase [Acidobacteriota bacterium]